MQIEFYTTKELIDEIMKRETFQGIIINSSKEFKGKNTSKFKFIYKNLSTKQAINILASTQKHINNII